MNTDNTPNLDLYDEFLKLNFRGTWGPSLPVNRREFLRRVGAGIVVLISFSSRLDGQQPAGRGARQLPKDFNAFLRIGEDGRVTGFTGKIEMGQGVHTSLAQTLAEELDVPLDSVEMVMGDTDLCPWDMGTFGSMTTRFFVPPFRAAAAEAKAVLIELAAERMGVAKEGLKTADGTVHDPASGKKVTYAELTKGQTIARHLSGEAVLETPSQFTLVGTPLARKDAADKVTGKAQYAGDISVPGMLFASILRPPAHGARMISADLSAARKVDGLHVIETDGLVAVLHELPDVAEEAISKVKAEWDRKKSGVNDKTIFDHLLKTAPEPEVAAQGGELKTGEAQAQLVVEETYLDSYTAHAPMEPHTAVARIDGDKVTIWASTQTPFRLKEEAASELGIPPDRVRVLPPFVGGGFGGKSSNRQAIEAIKLAKLTGRPVQVAWTRGEEFFLDTYRPAAVVKVRAGATRAGEITFWDYGVYGAGERGSQQFYEIPHHRTAVYGSGWRGASDMHPLATGAWRAPANNTNSFARESQIDILAARLGMDPVAFRLENLRDPKMIRVLKTVAERFGWKADKAPSGRGVGVAAGIDAGTYVAHIAEVEVDKNSGKIRVKRVACVQDMGLCVNPDGALMQMEGCITMGLGYTLAEEIRFADGEILDSNFDTYEIPRFSWLPEIDAFIVEDRESPPQGGGEPAIVCMGAVIANAVFDATGARLLRLPMTPERVKEALQKV